MRAIITRSLYIVIPHLSLRFMMQSSQYFMILFFIEPLSKSQQKNSIYPSFWCCHIWCQIHFFLNNLLENTEMNFTNGVTNTKAASYNDQPSLQIWKNCFGIKNDVDLIPSRSSSQDEENCSNLMLPLAKFDYVHTRLYHEWFCTISYSSYTPRLLAFCLCTRMYVCT